MISLCREWFQIAGIFLIFADQVLKPAGIVGLEMFWREHKTDNTTVSCKGGFYRFSCRECIETNTSRPCADHLQDVPDIIIYCRVFNFSVYIWVFLAGIVLCFEICMKENEEYSCTVYFATFFFSVLLRTSTHFVFIFAVLPMIGISLDELTVGAYLVYLCEVAFYPALFYKIAKERRKDRKQAQLSCTQAVERVRPMQTCKVCGAINGENTRQYIWVADYTVNIRGNGATQPLPQLMLHNLDVSLVNIMSMIIESLWEQNFVGIGRDARNISHEGIKISKIIAFKSQPYLERYNTKRQLIKRFADSRGGRLKSPNEYAPSIKAVATEFPVNMTYLKSNVDNDLNEFYLFHGTNTSNLTTIAQEGLRKSKSGMLGKGIYFADHPVKADQYSRQANEAGLHCMLLCRVLLGDAAIVTSSAVVHQFRNATSPPCKKCKSVVTAGSLCPDTNKTYDSVIYDGGLFREYIVYDMGMCLPEFAVIYKRQSQS